MKHYKFLNERTQRLFACWCVRHTPLADGRKVWDLLTDERSKNAVRVAERFAYGESSEKELAAAEDAAWAAARAAARTAARDAARIAARDAARAAVWAAAGAAEAAAWAAAGAAEAAGAANPAARAVARAAQARQLLVMLGEENEIL